MKIHTSFEQNSVEWLAARAGVVTASEADALISPKFEVRKGKGLDTYVAQKLAEKWTGGPISNAMTLDMDLGKIQEEEAIPALVFDYGWKIERPALITDDKAQIGCSPDGWLSDGVGLEVKCPAAQNHVKYLLGNVVPDDYVAQVQFSMFVTGAKQWKFVSYRRNFPTLVLTVDRDQEAQDAIKTALDAFLPRLDAAFERLVALNGGERPKANAFRETVMAEAEYFPPN
jgi:hypothetical protein